MKFYGSISKSEEQPDGTIKVWGVASSPSTDSQGETVTPEAMKAAIPGYMQFGAVREMHGSVAAGTAISIDVDKAGITNFCAHIVDPVSVLKVKTGVLKGFSIGGRATAYAPGDRSKITGLELSEISLVDRPANPDSIITVFKADHMPQPDKITKAAEPDQVSALTSVISALTSLIPKLQAIAAVEMQEPATPPAPGAVPEADVIEAADNPAAPPAASAPPAAAPQAAPEDQAKPAEAPAESVAKAGARFSAATKGQLADLHEAIKKCDQHLDGIGYKDTAKAAAEVELLKAENAKLKDQIAKAAAPRPHAGVAIDKTADATGRAASFVSAGGIVEKSHADAFIRTQRERAAAAGQIIKI